MKTLILINAFLFSLTILAQSEIVSGPIPFNNNLQIGDSESQIHLDIENIAYGYESLSFLTLSMPIPSGYPLTFYEPWLGFATSMCLGGNGYYYVTTLNGNVYRFYSLTKTISLIDIFDISGLITNDKVNGIAYNPVNNSYYIAAGSSITQSDNIYELNISTGVATLIGPTNSGGLQADLTITCDGSCYSYDLITKNSYEIDLATGNATLLGPLGFTPYHGQGMDVDRKSGIVYLSAFDSLTSSGQLRTLNTQTGETTLIASWGYRQICAFVVSTKCEYTCIFDSPTNPAPSTGTFGVPTTLDSLRWENDPSTTTVKLFFGEIWDMRLIYDGPVISSYPVQELQDDLVYTWRVIAANDSCERYSYGWLFGTIDNPTINILFEDDFENGTGNWELENINGYCNWELFEYPYPNFYRLPQTSGGNILSADADYCGTETTINSNATINQVFDLSSYHWVWLEFDYDWKVFKLDDKAIVEISTDAGVTWIGLWNQTGRDIRNCHEIVDATKLGACESNVKFRFKSEQPGWDWWWAIDNIRINGIICENCVPFRPSNLSLFDWGYKKIYLDWDDNSLDENGFNVERKLGDSLSLNQFEIVGVIEPNVHNFLDTTVSTSTLYTYRVNAFNENGNSPYTNWETILSHIPVELTSFSAVPELNEVRLYWSTATELNNHIFEIQRKTNFEEFYTVGYQEGHGTTSEPQNYTYIDKNVEKGKYYYRLKQLDFSGTFEYSEEIVVDVTGNLIFSLFQNHPNPFNPVTSIKYVVSSRQFVTLKVYDVLGNEVATLVNEEKQPGSYEVEFSVHSDEGRNLTSGIYFYQLKAGNYVETKKMVLMK